MINREAALTYINVAILLIGKARCRAELQQHAASLRANLDQLQELHVIDGSDRDRFEHDISKAVQVRVMELLPDHLRTSLRGVA